MLLSTYFHDSHEIAFWLIFLKYPRHGVANLYCDFIPDKIPVGTWRIGGYRALYNLTLLTLWNNIGRPLPENMLKYARSDTHFFFCIYMTIFEMPYLTALRLHRNPTQVYKRWTRATGTKLGQALARSAETSLRVYTREPYGALIGEAVKRGLNLTTEAGSRSVQSLGDDQVVSTNGEPRKDVTTLETGMKSLEMVEESGRTNLWRIGCEPSLVYCFAPRADWMIGSGSQLPLTTFQWSLFGPSESPRSSVSGSTLFATSAITLFGAVNLGSTLK